MQLLIIIYGLLQFVLIYVHVNHSEIFNIDSLDNTFNFLMLGKTLSNTIAFYGLLFLYVIKNNISLPINSFTLVQSNFFCFYKK